MKNEKPKIAGKLETGKLGIAYLKRFWSYSSDMSNLKLMADESSYAMGLCNALGIGLEPLIQYVYQQRPSFDQLEGWIQKNGDLSDESILAFNSLIAGNKIYEPSSVYEKQVLNDVALEKWKKDGYLILKNAISTEDCNKSLEVIYDFLNADPDKPSTWYRQHPAKQGIMIQLFNHPVLNKNRMSLKIRSAFEQLLNRKDLIVSMDRVSFNPPENEYYSFPGPDLHWDVSLQKPIPYGLQGLLYLTDTSIDQGAFRLIPGFHHKIESWLESLPENADPRLQDMSKFEIKPIAAEKGDFVIWHHALPHGSGSNTAKMPRIVQYINHQPVDMKIRTDWI